MADAFKADYFNMPVHVSTPTEEIYLLQYSTLPELVIVERYYEGVIYIFYFIHADGSH